MKIISQLNVFEFNIWNARFEATNEKSDLIFMTLLELLKI